MGVYIDMEMPKSCPCALTGIGYDMYCSFVHGIPARVKEYDECCEKGTRPDWCPAIEVPKPHGRLGDLDELYNHLNEWYLTHEHGFLRNEKIYIRAMLSGVKDAPTVIPASEEVST